MKLRLSRRARQDIAEIGQYIRIRNPPAAIAVRDAIQSTFEMLKTHPYAGRSIGRSGLHRTAVPRLPYLVFYRIDEAANALQIVTVRHAARQDVD